MRSVLAMLLLLGGCGVIHVGDDRAPHWRKPGPAALQPLERQIVPDDGFLDHLA